MEAIPNTDTEIYPVPDDPNPNREPHSSEPRFSDYSLFYRLIRLLKNCLKQNRHLVGLLVC